MLVTLVPFALGPDLNLLARIGPAILWIAAVLATLIGLDRLFQADEEDGSLDLSAPAPAPLELDRAGQGRRPLARDRAAAGARRAAVRPARRADRRRHARRWCATLLVGTPALTFIGAVGAALDGLIRRGGLILAILVAAADDPDADLRGLGRQRGLGGTVPFATPFLILAALSLIAAVVGTVGAAAALRWGE